MERILGEAGTVDVTPLEAAHRLARARLAQG